MSTKITTKKVSTRRTKKAAPPKASSANTQNLWTAYLGAVSLVRKQGASVVENLVDETKSLQDRSLQLAGNLTGDVRKQVEDVVSRVKEAANDNVTYLEERVGSGVSRVLDRMGVPSKEDIVELSKRVAELSRQVKALQNGRKSTLLGQAKAA